MKLKAGANIRQVAMVLCYAAKEIAVYRFRSFTQVDFLQILSYTFGRPPRPLLVHRNKHYDTKLTVINIIIVLVKLNLKWFKIFKCIRAHENVI